MFINKQLTGDEPKSQFRNAFSHALSDPFPEKQLLARIFNTITKTCNNRPQKTCDIF